MKHFRLIIYLNIIFYTLTALAITDVIKIGAGTIDNVSYPVAMQICKNIKYSSHDQVKCKVIQTKGSIENVKLLKEKKIHLALVQADVVLDAFYARGFFANEEPLKDARQILSLYDEIFTLIVKKESGIQNIKELDGKTLFLGKNLAGNRITYDNLIRLYKFKSPPKIVSMERPYEEILCNNVVDAIAVIVANPNPVIHKIVHKCDIDVVSLGSSILSKIVDNNRDKYKKEILPKGVYYDIDEDYSTFGTTVLLVGDVTLSPHLITQFTTYLQQNFDNFKGSHPALRNLELNALHTKILPHHDGCAGALHQEKFRVK